MVFVVLVGAFLLAVNWPRVIDTMFRPELVRSQFFGILTTAAKNKIGRAHV